MQTAASHSPTQETSAILRVDSTRARILYAELLLSCSRAQVGLWIGEWARSAGTSPGELLNLLWNERPGLPLEWEQLFYSHLEHWLESPAEFAENAFRRFSSQPALSARRILQAYKPHMPMFYSAHDQRQLMLKLLAPMHERTEADLRLVFQSIRFGRRSDLVLFLPRSHSEAYAHFDFATWRLNELRYAPVTLGLPAFEDVRLRSDFRSPDVILHAAGWKKEIPQGRSLLLTEFLRERGFEFVFNEMPDATGVVYSDDVRDPHTGKVLLSAGCLYGVPCALAEFRYATASGRVSNPFERLIGQLVETEFSIWTQIRERHELLCQELDELVEIVYRAADDSISVGTHHLMRNVPAKILRNVLREYALNGRHEFENREFKRDAEICMDPLNPNFEGRLNRVIDRLHQVSDVMSIEKAGRGRFRFTAHTRLRFREEF